LDDKGKTSSGGCFLIVLGLVLYFVRGIEATLILPVIGIVLLIAGIVYKPQKKEQSPANTA